MRKKLSKKTGRNLRKYRNTIATTSNTNYKPNEIINKRQVIWYRKENI